MNLRTEVSKALINRGYKRVGRVHIMPLDQEWSWLVDTGPIGTRTDIAPFVGVRQNRVEELIAEFHGRKPQSTSGTVFANVGYILGIDYKTWDDPNYLSEVLTAIDTAQERFKPFLSLEKLPEAWRMAKGTQGPGWQYSEIITYLLNGNRAAMLESINSARKELCRTDDGVCEQFCDFEKKLLSYLSTSQP